MRHWKIIGAIVSFVFWVAMQLSGFTSLPIAILLLAICAALLNWSAWPLRKRLSLKKGGSKMLIAVGVLIVIAGIILGGFLIISQLNINSEPQNKSNSQPTVTPPANIQPTSMSSNQFPTFVNGKQEVTLQLGWINMRGTVSDLMNSPHDYKVDTYTLLSFYIANHTLYVDTTLFGGDQLPQVQLKQNILVSMPQNWDSNSDSNAIEIVNNKLEPIFQLIYKTQYYIAINGYLYYPDGFMFVNEDGRAIMNPKTPPIDYSFKRIFQYPSSSFQGQREPATTPK